MNTFGNKINDIWLDSVGSEDVSNFFFFINIKLCLCYTTLTGKILLQYIFIGTQIGLKLM